MQLTETKARREEFAVKKKKELNDPLLFSGA